MVKSFFLLCSLALLSLSAHALERDQVKYVGGTLAGVTVGSVGLIDTTAPATLLFQHSGTKIAIPYASIESFQSSTEAARHLGVLPAIVVALLKARQHRHFVRISYRDQSEDHTVQVVIFEVPKGMSMTLQAVLEARASKRPIMAPGVQNTY
jgi:hypothetical protein